jgi:hypothetical protein
MLDQEETLYPSLSPLAVQVRWRIPTEFPACPDEFTDDGLLLYETRLSFGSLFARNQLSTSLVVHRHLGDDCLIVLTHFAAEAIKDWAVAHISIRDGLFHHRSESTFFSLKGALKHFCELTGEDIGDSIDDYC